MNLSPQGNVVAVPWIKDKHYFIFSGARVPFCHPGRHLCSRERKAPINNPQQAASTSPISVLPLLGCPSGMSLASLLDLDPYGDGTRAASVTTVFPVVPTAKDAEGPMGSRSLWRPHWLNSLCSVFSGRSWHEASLPVTDTVM